MQLYKELCLHPPDWACSETGRECNTTNKTHVSLEEGKVRAFSISVIPICQFDFSDHFFVFLILPQSLVLYTWCNCDCRAVFVFWMVSEA